MEERRVIIAATASVPTSMIATSVSTRVNPLSERHRLANAGASTNLLHRLHIPASEGSTVLLSRENAVSEAVPGNPCTNRFSTSERFECFFRTRRAPDPRGSGASREPFDCSDVVGQLQPFLLPLWATTSAPLTS